MEDPRLADAPAADAGPKHLRLSSSHRAELSVITEVDLVSHQYPISRVRWRQLLSPAGD